MVFTVSDLDFKAGRQLTVGGRIRPSCKMFSVNIGHNPDQLALHFNPRFDHLGDVRTIVLNSKKGEWIQEDEERDTHFPFQAGQDFMVAITYNKEKFNIKLQDGNVVTFANRFGEELYNHLHVSEDISFNNVSLSPK
ncbi:galactose-binding lectin l-1-like [Paramisgurnus dabryanus]|uniref:galactose-binding lectin l-1-like n=1 Tax=Paramisgurnus dabryanus TaxID=90735 RepID=UPI0031F340D7